MWMWPPVHTMLVYWGTVLLHASLCVCLYICLCGHCYRFLQYLLFFFLLYIKLTISASFPSVPNNHPHPCVCACRQDSVLKYGCFLFFIHAVWFPQTHSDTHTCAYDGKHWQLLWSLQWWLLNALVSWCVTGVWELTKTCHLPTHFETPLVFIFVCWIHRIRWTLYRN